MSQITFTVYARPEPQGSMKGFIMGKSVRLTSNNTKLKPYRQELTNTAQRELERRKIEMPMAGRHVAVSLVLDFFLARPASIPKKRTEMVVKPDLDKLIRATKDALKGILYLDDGQVIEVAARKHYGLPERVSVSATVHDHSRSVFDAVDATSLFSPDLDDLTD